MAFPDYSFLVIERFDSQTQTVTRERHLFTDVKDAQSAYRSEIQQANTRVFLFEQPQPTKFKRNDSIPLPTRVDTWD
jgi:hypothetical protein